MTDLIMFAIGAAVGFRAGVHISAIGIWHGARQRLTEAEWREFDRLMDKALDKDAPQ